MKDIQLVDRWCPYVVGENIPAFIRACLFSIPEGRIKAALLYSAYVQWCQRVGAHATADPYLFGRELTAYGFTRTRVRGVVYVGIGFRPDVLDVPADVLRDQVHGTTVEAARRRKWLERNRTRARRGYPPFSYEYFCSKEYGKAEWTTKEAVEQVENIAADENQVAMDARLLEWARDALVRVVGACESLPAAYSCYGEWAERAGIEHYELKDFATALMRLGYTVQGRGHRAGLAQFELKQ